MLLEMTNCSPNMKYNAKVLARNISKLSTNHDNDRFASPLTMSNIVISVR